MAPRFVPESNDFGYDLSADEEALLFDLADSAQAAVASSTSPTPSDAAATGPPPEPAATALRTGSGATQTTQPRARPPQPASAAEPYLLSTPSPEEAGRLSAAALDAGFPYADEPGLLVGEGRAPFFDGGKAPSLSGSARSRSSRQDPSVGRDDASYPDCELLLAPDTGCAKLGEARSSAAN